MWWFLAVVTLLPVIGWGLISTQRILFPERFVPNPLSPQPVYTVQQLTAYDGTPFDVWIFGGESPRARLLLLHGYSANRLQVLDVASDLSTWGYEVLLFELRGHGNRPGPCTLGVKEAQDAKMVLDWVWRRDGSRHLPVGVIGWSMGGAIACQVAAQYPQVKAVVVDSVYSRLFPVLSRSIWFRYHLPAIPWTWVTWWCLQLVLRTRLARRDPVVLAPSLRQPLLAIQGGEDQRVAPVFGEEFYQRWAGPKERWFEPKVAHVRMYAAHPQHYCERVAHFFERTLAQSTEEMLGN